MNSLERVKAAIKFEGPDKVPTWSFIGNGDVFSLARIPSMRWQPGHNENENGLFPHLGDDLILKAGLWKWKRPEWAKAPEFTKWNKVSREEIDEWGNIWIRKGVDTMGHPGRPTLTDYSQMEDYFKKYTPIYDDEKSFDFFKNLSQRSAKEKYRMGILELGPSLMASQLRGFDVYLMDHRRNKEMLKNP